MTRARPNGKVVILTEEALIFILELDFMVIILDVVKRDIALLNVDPLKVGKVTEMFCFKEMMGVHQVDLRLAKI